MHPSLTMHSRLAPYRVLLSEMPFTSWFRCVGCIVRRASDHCVTTVACLRSLRLKVQPVCLMTSVISNNHHCDFVSHSFAVIDFALVHSKASQSSKFALHGVPLATALNGCRQTGSSTLHAHNVGTYRPYESDYLGASNISVMDCTAVLTAPFTHIERKPRASMPAIRAYARRALPGIEFKHLAAMPIRLVSDLAGKLAQSYIADRTRKFVVSKHPLHVVRLYRQRLVLANQLTTRFVQEILACVGDAGVQASHPKPLPSISIGSSSLSGQPSLRPLEVLFPLL